MNSLSKPVMSPASALTLDIHRQIHELETYIAQTSFAPKQPEIVMKDFEYKDTQSFESASDPLYFLSLSRFKGNEHLVGFIRLILSASHFRVTHLAVHPDWSGRGISSRLVQAVFSHVNQKALPGPSY